MTLVAEMRCSCCGHNTWQRLRGYRLCSTCDRLQIRNKPPTVSESGAPLGDDRCDP